MKTTATLFLFLVITALRAQDVCGFLDYRNYFHGFDRGTFMELEALPPRAFTTGGNYLAYASSNGDLKVFQNGAMRTIDQNIATPPIVTDHYFGYVSAGALRVYDGEELLTLCRNTGGHLVEDSIVGFFDTVQRTIHIHYRGKTEQVEDALMGDALHGVRSGDNILAWVSTMTKELKIHYHGEVWVLETLVDELPFWASLDLVAYKGPVDNGLKVFYKGDVLDVEAFMPTQLHMGKGLFAYVDVSGALKVFQNGKTYTAQGYAPDEFFVQDSLVVIRDQGQMKVFKDGRTTTVLSYFPELWRASWGTLAWLDVDGTLKAWHDGTITTVLQRETVKGFTLDRGLITINLTNNKVKIWWNGTLYEH